MSLEAFSVPATWPSGSLFTSIGLLEPAGSLHGEGATAAWSVTIDFALLAALPEQLLVNFPDRNPVTLQRVRSQNRGPGAFLWSGRGGDCSGLFSAAQNGWFKATLSCLNASYGIETDGSDVQLAIYDEPGEAPPDDPAPAIPPIAMPKDCPDLPGVGDQLIDILVLYTETVRAHLDPGGGHINTDLEMRYAVDQTQFALDNSTENTTPPRPVIAAVNFVGAVKVLQDDSGDTEADLAYVTGHSEAKALRDAYGADIVMYVVWDGGSQFLGLSNLAGWPPYPPPGECYAPFAQAALVQSASTNPGDYVFAHEFAHLFGANHDDYSVNNPWAVQSWAYGWWQHDPETNAGMRTLMAQDAAPCATGGSPCTRILHYSNHLVESGWFVTGQENSAENSRVIDEFAEVTAQYRASIDRIFANGFE